MIFVLEFKIGEKEFSSHFIDQVYDYALDLRNFHESSHSQYIVPILIATEANAVDVVIAQTPHKDKLLLPIKTNGENLKSVIDPVLGFANGEKIDPSQWEQGRYCPTPTIIEAAMALYNNHSVADISRSDASAINLSYTSDTISEIIRYSREKSCKSVCFVTGVPGAGAMKAGGEEAAKAQGELTKAQAMGPLPAPVKAPKVVVPIMKSVWQQYTATARKFNEPGRVTAMIGFEWTSVPVDALIAATAHVHALTLVTRNEKAGGTGRGDLESRWPRPRHLGSGTRRPSSRNLSSTVRCITGADTLKLTFTVTSRSVTRG